MGGRKLYSLLKEQIAALGYQIGRDKFFDLLRDSGLLVERRRKYARTTQSFHRFWVHPNLLEQYRPARANEVWVCDITYVRFCSGFMYLFLLTDAYSRMIVGWELSEHLGVSAAITALTMALKQCRLTTGLIHHSDRGFQYCSPQYVSILQSRGIRISMAEAGNCYQNAMAERVNGILKAEYDLDNIFTSKTNIYKAVKQAIYLYNNLRPHWALGMKIPAHVHRAA